MITVAALAAGILAVAEPALAAVDRYEVQVDGLACPFCAYGLEKKLKRLPGAKNVQIELNAGRATFDVAGSVLLPGAVKDAVRDAGFTARDITVTASGTIESEGNDLRLDIGGEQTLVLRGGEAFGELQGLVKKEQRDVVVTGLIRRVDDTWQLAVAEAKPQ
jgi:mercuric ion binding protein